MKRIVFDQHGGPEVMRIEEIETPQPQAGQALVKVAAAGVNFIDIYHRLGMYKIPLPYFPGGEGAGSVAAVGPGVTEVRPGDRVAWVEGPGSYATEVLLRAEKLVPVPEGMDLQQVAAVILQGMTAYVLTHRTFPLKAGQRCLVHAAAGGVGLLLCQIGKMLGAEVIGTTSTEEKALRVREAGAAHAILYTHQDFEQEVKRITSGQGVQVVYDSVGKDTFDKSLECLAPLGYLVSFGQSSGFPPPLDIQRLGAPRSLFVTRPTIYTYIREREALLHHAGVILDWVRTGQLKVRIDRSFPLHQAAEAQETLKSRKTSGKVLLIL